jgi:hypothetical protein
VSDVVGRSLNEDRTAAPRRLRAPVHPGGESTARRRSAFRRRASCAAAPCLRTARGSSGSLAIRCPQQGCSAVPGHAVPSAPGEGGVRSSGSLRHGDGAEGAVEGAQGPTKGGATATGCRSRCLLRRPRPGWPRPPPRRRRDRRGSALRRGRRPARGARDEGDAPGQGRHGSTSSDQIDVV